jgi:hypothetical protein
MYSEEPDFMPAASYADYSAAVQRQIGMSVNAECCRMDGLHTELDFGIGW